jgi:hypothetical protein
MFMDKLDIRLERATTHSLGLAKSIIIRKGQGRLQGKGSKHDEFNEQEC